MNPKQDVLLIDWVDSCADNGWMAEENCVPRVLICQTIGFLVKEAPDSYLVALNRATADNYRPFSELMTIPKVAVIRTKKIMTILKEDTMAPKKKAKPKKVNKSMNPVVTKGKKVKVKAKKKK